jgi:hypothetical protein
MKHDLTDTFGAGIDGPKTNEHDARKAPANPKRCNRNIRDFHKCIIRNSLIQFLHDGREAHHRHAFFCRYLVTIVHHHSSYRHPLQLYWRLICTYIGPTLL